MQPQTRPERFTQAYAEARSLGHGHLTALKVSDASAAEAENWLEEMVTNKMRSLDPLLSRSADA